MDEQLEELEDDLQQTKDQKMRLEVNRQAKKTQLERNRTAKEEVRKGKRRGMAKKLRDLETESVWDKYNFFWTNEYPNIFVTVDIGRMNIRIFSTIEI